AVDHLGLGNVDEQCARLNDSELAPADEAMGRRAARQMNAHAIRAGEQFIDRTVACAVALFNLRRKAMALRVADAHLLGRGRQRQLASDLSHPDDPELLAVKCLESGDA